MTTVTLSASATGIPPGASFQDRQGRLLTVSAAGTVIADTAIHSLAELAAAGFEHPVKSGPTSARPAVTWPGLVFFDTTLNMALNRSLSNSSWVGPNGEAR